jgi:predicted permease
VGPERLIRVVGLRLRSIVFRTRVDTELDDELAYHLDRLVDEHVASGLTPAEARSKARASMYGVQQRKEACRDMRRVHVVEEFVDDVRFAGRQFAKNPGFTAIVVAILALAIGGNTAVYSVMHAVFAPLPIPNADRVVAIWTDAPSRNWHQFPASMADIRDWEASGVFSSVTAFTADGVNLRLADRTDRVEGMRSTASFFDVLGAKAARGRLFAKSDRPDDHLVVLTDRLWHTTFNDDPDIVGKSAVLDGTPHTVIGVLPPGATRFGREELYVLFPEPVLTSTDRGSRSFGALGRIRDGLTLAAARQRMIEVSEDLARRFPKDDGGLTASLQPVQEAFVQDAQLLLTLLMGAVICALGVACANIASLLLAKGLARRRELAIRTALGGGRWRLVRQLLTEHLLLGVIGGVVSFLPALWGIRFIASYNLEELPNVANSGINIAVLGFTAVVALMTGVLCGVVPASLAWKHDVSAVLKGSANIAAGRTQHRIRGAFVVGQIALTAVLLVAGGLMLRSFLHILTSSPGYASSHVLTMRVALPDTQYQSPDAQSRFFDSVLERARTLPGVVAVAAVRELPTSDDVHGSGLLFPGQPEPRLEDIPLALRNSVTSDYFRTMQIPIVAGRAFADSDTKDSTPVVLIDEWTAHRYWPNQNPVGQQVKSGRSQPWREIVGIVGNVEAPVVVTFLKGRVAQVYLPMAQDPYPAMMLAVRAAGDPAALAGPMRSVVRNIDPNQPVFRLQTLNDVRVEGQRVVRLVTTVLGVFALLALLLATIGLYGTVAFDVGQRTREFGIRLSLGARPSSVLSLVLRRGSLLLIVGAALGLIGAVAFARMVGSYLYGVQSGDPTTFAAAAFLLTITGLLAAYVPARRATKINPVVALRCE